MSYIGRGLQSGAFRQLDSIASSFNGSTTGFTMQVNSTNVIMGDANQILLSLGGVIQNPGTDFTISSSTLTFTTAPAANTSFFAILIGSDNGGTVTPTDLSVTTAKIAADNVTKAKLADSIDIFAGTALSAADLGVGIHIKTADSSGSANASGDELIIENNGPAGMTILSANDNVGLIAFGDDGANNRGYLMYNHDGDVFSIGAAAATQMTIDSAGKTGVAESTLASQFHVTAPSGFSQYIVDFDNASTSAPYGLFQNYSGAAPDSGSDYEFFKCQDTGGARFIVYSDGDVKNHDNSYGSLSDERIKQNITDANSQWNDIKAIKVRNFKRKDDVRQYGEDKAKIQIGLIAQELESVSSSLVDEAKPSSFDILSSSEFGTLYEDGDTIPDGKKIGDVKEVKENVKGIKYSVLYMKAIKALQEAMARIEALEAK